MAAYKYTTQASYCNCIAIVGKADAYLDLSTFTTSEDYNLMLIHNSGQVELACKKKI